MKHAVKMSMMSPFAITLALYGLAGLSACDDNTASGTHSASDADLPDMRTLLPPPDAGVDAEAPDMDLSPDAELRMPDAEPPAPDAEPEAPVVAWVQVELSPRQLLYRPGQEIEGRLEAFDRIGEPVEGLPVSWEVVPPEMATVDADGRVTFSQEGPGALLGCVPSGPAETPVCEQAAFYVDAGAPTLTVESPADGVVLGGDLTETIPVRGVALDAGGSVSVLVNGLRVEVAEDGSFGIDLPAQFGLNRVVVTADDGVRQPPVQVVREALWAPHYLEIGEAPLALDTVMWLNLEQGILSSGAPRPPEVDGVQPTEDLTSLIELIVEAIDPGELLGPLGLDEGLAIELSEADIGPVELSMAWSTSGLEIFLRLPRLSLEIEGELALEGTPIVLDGTLTAALAGFATVEINEVEGNLVVEVDEASVALESLDGDLGDPRAQAVLDTFGSQFRGVVEGAVDDVLRGVLVEQLPALVEVALLSLTDALGDLPLNLDTGVEGVPPVRMRLALDPDTLTLRRQATMGLTFSGEITHENGAPVPPHQSPGLPTLTAPDGPARGIPEAAGGPLTLGVHLDLVNAILHEVWRGGLLTLEPALPEAAQGLVDEVTLDGRLPPLVVPADPWAETALEAQIGALDINVVRPGAPEPDRYTLSIRAGLDLRPEGEGLTLALADRPDVVAQYLGGPQPLAAYPEDVVAELVATAIWPAVADALAGGLALPVGTSAIDVGELQDLTPDIEGISVGPVFPRAGRLIEQWLVLEGALLGEITSRR
ncbi:MAG: hypothetical protein ACE366_05310 [Bradymonadia bacterium]